MMDFELPIIKDIDVKKKALSMDEYHAFVQFNLKNAFDRKSYEKQKKLAAVDVRFSFE